MLAGLVHLRSVQHRGTTRFCKKKYSLLQRLVKRLCNKHLKTLLNRNQRMKGLRSREAVSGAIDPLQKWLPLNYSFVHIQNSPTNLVFETKILKNLLS